MELTYREQIIQIINNLIEAREIIFEQIVNLAMSNEFKHLQNAFQHGDTYSFSLKHFEKIDEVNIQKLVKLCRFTESTVFTMMTLNGINNAEVNLIDD